MIRDLLLPATDRAVLIQVVVTVVALVAVSIATRKIDKEIRLLIWGIFMMIFSWFAIRALH